MTVLYCTEVGLRNGPGDVAIAFIVTIIFQASVEVQGDVYATGVLVLMSLAAFAVTLAAYEPRSRKETTMFGMITVVFCYTTIVNIFERPEGIRIAAFFITAIVVTSLVSQVLRSTELRVERVEMDNLARDFLAQSPRGVVRLIANRRGEAMRMNTSTKRKKCGTITTSPQRPNSVSRNCGVGCVGVC